MDIVVALSWRAYPAVLLIAAGLALAVWGVAHGASVARHEAHDPGRALALLRGFRMGVIGLALAGVSAAWWGHIEWLLALSLIIGGEELLESTVIITALRHSPHSERDSCLLA